MIHYLYIALCSPPNVKSPVAIYLTPFTLSYLPPSPFSSGKHHTVLCVYEGFFYCCSITVVPTSSPPLFPPCSTTPTSHIQSFPHCLCPWVLYTCFLATLPLLSPVIPLPLSSGHCQFVLYFHVSGSIFLICLFC